MATANDDNVELEDNIEEVLTKYYFYRFNIVLTFNALKLNIAH